MWTSVYIKNTAIFDRIFIKYKKSDFYYDLSSEFHFRSGQIVIQFAWIFLHICGHIWLNTHKVKCAYSNFRHQYTKYL